MLQSFCTDLRENAMLMAARSTPRINPKEYRAYCAGPWIVTPRARIEGTVYVMRKEPYADEWGAICPFDFAVAWGVLVEPRLLSYLTVTQAKRWLHWRSFPRIPHETISQHSANWHLCPASDAVYETLWAAPPRCFLTIKGRLIDIVGPSARWNTSMTLGDTGDGACEIILVEAAASSRC